MPRPPAQHRVCLQHREDQGHQVSLISAPYQCTGPQHSIVFGVTMAENMSTRLWDLVCHISARVPSTALRVGHMAKKQGRQVLWIGVPYQCTSPPAQHCVYRQHGEEKMQPGCVDMVSAINAQVLAQHCVLNTWRRKMQPGVVYCGAISMHRPQAQHCVCCAHCQVISSGVWDRCAMPMRRPPAPQCVC